jgi:peptidoglycan/LPS O-acetylase OafA/YrhL
VIPERPGDGTILTGAIERLGRSDGIDALRGVFVLWVMLAHIVPWTQSVLGMGSVWTPVAMLMEGLAKVFQPAGEIHPAVVGFIVLSGYCIHRNGLRTDRSEMAPFIVRRCFRILPVYVLASVVGIVAFYADHEAPMFSMATSVRGECLAAKFFFYSVLTPAFHPCSVVGNAPLGTVTVEIVLYAIYALFFSIFVWRNSERWIWIICGLSWLASVVMAFFAPNQPAVYNWWQNASIYGFLPYWWLGAAFVNPAVAAAMRRTYLPILVLWLALTAILLLLGQNAVIGEIRKLVFACCVGLIVCWLETAELPRRNPLSAAGRAGYSIYAFHGPVAGTLALLGTQWWLNIAACITVGQVAFALVERPFIRLGKSVASRAQGNMTIPPAALMADGAQQ